MDDMRITSYSLRYYVNPPEANCPSVFPVEPTTRIQRNNGDSWVKGQWRTDIETDLKGINRFSSRVRCDEKLYNPETNKFNNIALEHPEDSTFPLTFNRLTNPPCTLRATGWNRWQPLFHDPTKTFEQPFDYFIPSRTMDKEKYKCGIRGASKPAIPSYDPLQNQSKFGQGAVEGSQQALA
jgi:hypothetical protein